MKFLADMGISVTVVKVLRQQGYDAVHLLEESLERLLDAEILEKAKREERIILTCDLDFGDLLAIGGYKLPSVVLFRLKDYTPASVTPKLLEVLSTDYEALSAGAIVTVEDSRVRLRRLPIR